MKKIKICGRYGYVHTLEHIKDNWWLFKCDPKSTGGCRYIGFEGEEKINYNNLYAFDPEGGPFIAVGSKIDGKTVKSITGNGIFELI